MCLDLSFLFYAPLAQDTGGGPDPLLFSLPLFATLVTSVLPSTCYIKPMGMDES